MAESRTKNTSRNIIWGIAAKGVNLFLPFVTRTIVLYLLGTNYLGIGTLFSSILNFLSLTELGFSTAIVYSMYEPIVNNDIRKINAILNYYRRLYRVIGCVMLLIGTVLVPMVPHLIKGAVPGNINVYVLYYIYLVNSVISYFFAGYRASLLSAHQREDICTKRTTAVYILVQILQIAVLLFTQDFYVYALVPIMGTVLTNLLNAVITRKMYPEIRPEGALDTETKRSIREKVSGLIGTKLSSVVLHSADTIVISTFLGLTIVAQYGNYYMIFNAVCGFIAVFFSSMTASIGNKLVTDSIEENYSFFKKLSFLNAWIVSWASVCFLCLYEPFMELWAGKELCLGTEFACLLTLYFYIYQIQKTILTFKDAAGIWHADRIRPYVVMTVNVFSNLIMVQFIGIYGIVLSTVVSLLISLPWVNKVLFKNLFHKAAYINLFAITKNLVITVALCIITYIVCSLCKDGILGILERLVICCVVPNLLFIVINRKTKEFKYWIMLVLKWGKK